MTHSTLNKDLEVKFALCKLGCFFNFFFNFRQNLFELALRTRL